MKRIAIGGLHTECSSYSPLEQALNDFTRLSGQALIDAVPFDFASEGIEAIPLFQDRAVPGGPVATATFAKQRTDFMDALRAAGPLDGVLLLMHGAMFVPGLDDPEGAFITEVRDIVGPEALISGSFDLHGQVTQKIVDALDMFAAYRTAPHIDVPQTHERAAKMLARALHTPLERPMVCWTPIPILAPGEMTSTFVAPCDALYAALPNHDASPQIWDSNLMIGYVWADSPRATASAVVTTTDTEAGQAVSDRIAQSYHTVRDELVFDMPTASLSDALSQLGDSPAILADSGDNPTAGGVGDRADVLSAFAQGGKSSALFAGIADPAAYDALLNGASSVDIGGSLGGGGPRLTITPDTCRFANDCAILDWGGLVVVLTKRRRPFHNLTDFSALDLNLDSFQTLVVKSGYLSPDLRDLPRQQMMALTEGAVCQDLSQLANEHRPAGTWPFTA